METNTYAVNQWDPPDRYFDFEGRNVAWGMSGTGPPLVLVHGTPWSSYNLRHLVAGLAATHRVYYYDLLGYGASSKEPGDVSLAVQNQVLCALLTHWDLHEPAVVGHDFGGATVLRARLLNTRCFRRIVLIDPVAVAPWGSSFFIHVAHHEEAFAGVPAYMHEAMVRSYIQTAAHRPIASEVLEHTVRPWQGDRGQAAFYRQIAQARQAHTDEVQERYGEVDQPVLILWGEEDRWIPMQRGVALHELIPNSVFHTIADAGHLVVEEAPAALVGHISRFLHE